MKALKSNIDRNINREKNRCWVDLKRYLKKDNRCIDGQIDENIFIER